MHEKIYVESKDERLLFSNSCWEIQRVNPMAGGNMILDEVCRLKHVATGKFLAVSQDNSMELTLVNSSNNLYCLFKLRSDMSQKKENKFGEEMEDDDEDDAITNYKLIESG
jgi:hypothetical protein